MLFCFFIGLDCAVWSPRWTKGAWLYLSNQLVWSYVIILFLHINTWNIKYQEYLLRVGRTVCGEGAKGNALLFLTPEELKFLRYLKVCWQVIMVVTKWTCLFFIRGGNIGKSGNMVEMGLVLSKCWNRSGSLKPVHHWYNFLLIVDAH